MWIEFLIIKIISFFVCSFLSIHVYGRYVLVYCSSIVCHPKIWWVANFLYKHSFIHVCTKAKSTFLLFAYFLSYVFSGLTQKIYFCVFVSLWSVCVSCTDIYFFAWKFTFFLSPSFWDVNQTDRVRNWYSFCFSFSVFDGNINFCRKMSYERFMMEETV